MISCPITQLPLENFYKYVYRAIKDKLGNDKSFDVNDFMETLFEESVKNSDPETAAKWLQSTPRVINLIITKSFSDKIPLVKGLDSIYQLMTDFSKPNGEGFKNVLAKYVKPVDVNDLKAAAAYQIITEFSTEEEEPSDEEKEKTPSETSASPRLKTPVAMSGTLPAFVPVDPSEKTKDYIEKLDKPRARIIANLGILGDALNMSGSITKEFVYQKQKIKVKATNLYAFSQQHFNELDPITQAELKNSALYTGLNRAQANVTQADKRVLLVITDENGKNIYFDEQGNITNKENGNLVYQFMRDVRKTAKGYTVTDIYGKEEQLMPIDTYAQMTYDQETHGNYETYLKKVRDDREKELKRLYEIREKALGTDVILEFSGLSTGISSEITATKLPLSDFLKIPGASRSSLKTIRTLNKAEGKFRKGRALITLNGTEFQVNRSTMPDSIADQIAAVMFDPNIPFETKKDFYSQFIPEDGQVKLAYTMRKHEIKPDMVNKSFKINIYENVGTDAGFVEEPLFKIPISEAVLKKATPEQISKGIEVFSKALKQGRRNNKATYMSYKTDLLNSEEYFVYNSNTKEIEIGNYIDFLSTLDGYIDLFDGDPGFYNKHMLFNEPTKLDKEIKKANEAVTKTFEEEVAEAMREADELRALENTNKSFADIEFDVIKNRALNPEYREQLAQQGFEGKYDSFYFTSSLIGAMNVNKDVRYTREVVEQLRDMFIGAKLISGKQIDTVNNNINRIFPKTNPVAAAKADVVQKTIEPEMPDPVKAPAPAKGRGRVAGRFGKSGSLDRAGYIADEIGEKDIEKVLDWWENTKLGKELQKHITLEHAYNLVNSDVFARFVISGSTLTNPDIKGSIKINKGKGTLVDIYHEAWHAFSQLYLTRKQKYALYNEVLNYKDADGNEPYKTMSYKEIDELLAEDFRTYMKSNYVKKGSPMRNSLFRKIMNFLRSLFGRKGTNPTEVLTDVMNVPAVREMFEKLNYSSNKDSFVRQYQANIDNVDFFELDRGISKLNKPSDSALSNQDSRLISDTMDMVISDIIDDQYYYKLEEAAETGNYNSLKSGTIGLLTDPSERAVTYTIIKERLEERLQEFRDQLHLQEGITPFSEIKKLESTDPNEKTIESESVAVFKSSKGEDKYVFLKSQMDGFDNLNAEMDRGNKVKGESWHGIKIVGDFYSHKSIKKNGKPVSIIVVSNLEDARIQYDNYIEGEAKEFTDFIEKEVPDFTLTSEQELILDNIRILQAAVDNYGDPEWEIKGIEPTGTIAYHLENSDFELSKTKYYLDADTLDEEGEEIDPDQENQTRDSETPFGGEKVGKKSLMQLASKEVIYILKSLHKVNRDGEVSYNRLGFKERAEFRKVWNIVTKTIGGVRDRVKAYELLQEEAKKFPEIAQLIETKFPDPKLITNTFEQNVSNSFWQTFAKPSVKYWQFTAFPQYGEVADPFTGQMETVIKGFESEVTQSSIEIDSIIRKFESTFKSSFANEFVEKQDNQSLLKLDNVIKAFENKKYPNQLDISKAFEFAAVLGIKLDDLPVIRKSIQEKTEYYGLPYFYDIIKDFRDIQKSEKATSEQIEFLNKFISNPVGTLRGEIPKGVLKSFKKEVAEKNILKRIAELQSQYGHDSANPGVLLPDGNRVFENVNHSQVTVTIDALNTVNKLSDFWTEPKFKYMSHLKPGKSFFTSRSKLLGGLFDMNTFEKRPNKKLDLIMTAGTQIADLDGVNTSDLDKMGKFIQEFHTMTMGGIAEFIRHAEKKSAFGIKLNGGVQKIIVNGISRGVDQNLYIDLNKFALKPGESISDGDIVAVGGYMLDYMAVEFDRIRFFKQNPDALKTIKGFNRKAGKTKDGKDIRSGEVFAFFDNILTDDTKEEIYALASDPVIDLPTYIKNNQDLYLKVQKDITAYFTEKATSLNNDYFKFMPYVDQKVLDKAGITNTDLSKNPNAVIALLKGYLYNDWFHKFETFNLINGDLAQFSDPTKRAPGSTSDGEGFLNDKYMHNFINNIFNKRNYSQVLAKQLNVDASELDKFVMDGTLNTAVIADAERKSVYLDEYLEAWEETYRANLSPIIKDKKKLEQEIQRRLAKDAKAYEEMKESDGAAFMTFDAYRVLRKMGNSWSIAQEALYQQILNGVEIDPLKVKEFFPIYKLHYYGSIANAPIATTAMHKFAVAPILPTVAIPGTEMHNLHVKMLKSNVQYVTFGSGSKVSTLTLDGDFDNIFGDSEAKTVSMDAPMKINQIYLEYLKDVTKVSTKLKKEISYPTQKRVLLLDGLFNVGDIINKANESIAVEYRQTVDEYTETLVLDLLNKIGYEFDEATGKYVGKLDKFIALIRDELGTKEVPEHLIKLLDTSLSNHLSMDFSLHPEADMLEKVIVNRIQKSIIKQKTKGEALVQAPGTFYNGVWSSPFERDEAIRKNDALIKKHLGSNVLPFYRRGEIINKKTGERAPTHAMKIAVAFNGDFLHLLNLKHPDGEKIGTRDRLNDLLKDEDWMKENRNLVTITGPRIPTDAANTMEFAEVWHFIDPSAGNTVIVPSEIVAKAGSDFDVDKIFFMMPNINPDGTLVQAPVESLEELRKMVKESTEASKKERKEKGLKNPQALIDQYKKAVQNKLIQSTRDILALPDNFTSLTKPNNTYLVEDQVEFYDKYALGYNNKKNAHREPIRVIDGKEVMSPSRIGDIEYNLNQHEANLSGALPLGIMAKKNKVHALFKSVGAYMPKAYKASKWNEVTKKYDEIPIEYDVVVRMKHNKTTNKKGEEVVSLSHENNVAGEKIGDIFSHSLQGILDRAKNPFPFKLKIVKEAITTINHLLESGVDVPEAFAFVNNPWIADYIDKQMLLGGSASLLMVKPILKHQVKSKAVKMVIDDMSDAGLKKEIQSLADYANTMRLMDTVELLKKDDLNKRYSFILIDDEGKLSQPMDATGKRMFESDDFPLNRVVAIKEYQPNTNFNFLKPIYSTSPGIANNDNYYYAAQEAWKRAFGSQEYVSEKELKDLVVDGKNPSMKNLAILLHMVQLEKQFSGLDSLELAFNPDTGLLDTTLQIKKRDDAFKLFENEQSKIDSDFLNRLRYDSILSSFYKSEMIMDLVKPLFSLRLNDQISDYIEQKITQNKDMIAQRYGPGVKGQERFTNMYNNAVVNYIFQNTMSNYTDKDGEVVSLPETIHTYSVTEVTTGPGITYTDNTVKVNLEQVKRDYTNKVHLTLNNTPDGFRAKNMDTFNADEDPFPTFSSYLKFMMEKEYLRTVYTKENLANNKDFQKFSYQAGSEDLGYDKFITQEALMKSFNRAFIMGTTKYSYTSMVTDIINEFEDQNIKENYPVLAQLAPAKFVKDVNVLELNDKALAKGVIADDYYKNLKQLGDPTVRKVQGTPETKEITKEDNKRISEVFKDFSLFMFYQHGSGYSKLGFVKVLDPEAFIKIMQNASNSFMNNELNEATFDKIFASLSAKSQFKNYTVDPTDIAGNLTIDDVTSTFSEDDWAGMEDFLGSDDRPTAKPQVSAGVEISSNAKGLAAALTNPTELAKFKGNLTQSYPVEFRGKTYRDSEEAYQALKGTASKDNGPGSTYNLMVEIIKAKLEQYPRLLNGITKEGGSEWLLASTHQPTKKNTVWETGGQNWFIKALNDAYVSLKPTTQPPTTSTSESVADIPQNKVSGINSYGSTVTANNEAIKALGPNPHSIDMIEAGFRTRTTRSESEMSKYAVKVGDTIKHFGKSADGSTKTVYAKVTAIHPKGSPGWKGTWSKEGWRAEDVNVIDRFKDGAAAIEFEVIQPSTKRIKIEYPETITKFNISLSSKKLVEFANLKQGDVFKPKSENDAYSTAVKKEFGKAAGDYVSFAEIEISIEEGNFLKANSKFAGDLVNMYIKNDQYKDQNGDYTFDELQDFAKKLLDENKKVIDTWQLKLFDETSIQQVSTTTQPTGSPVSNTNKPKGEEVVPGIYVNQAALTKEEQLELFDYLKPYLEEQAAKTNKGTQASKMIGLGLRWDYKSNNVGRTAVNIQDVINPGNKNKYGYYDVSINNQPLGQITPRFRELMQKATGVDMTNYDGAIINLYEKDTFISSHNDVDESKSAIKYPVIGINLGGKGNFSIERIPGAGQLNLEAGTGYIFGVDGVNREVWHRTFPTPQDTFLPELTTKIDGKTYPAGSYRVTITMRRVMPLEPGMPTAPAKITTQPTEVNNDTVASENNAIINFYNSLSDNEKSILGNLADLIAEYEDVPFDYTEQEFIESLKCKL